MSVKIYSTPTCGYCNIAKNYLKEKKVSFTDYNVAMDQSKAEEMYMKTGQLGVPVIDFNGSIVIGFDKNKIDKLIEKVEVK